MQGFCLPLLKNIFDFIPHIRKFCWLHLQNICRLFPFRTTSHYNHPESIHSHFVLNFCNSFLPGLFYFCPLKSILNKAIWVDLLLYEKSPLCSKPSNNFWFHLEWRPTSLTQPKSLNDLFPCPFLAFVIFTWSQNSHLHKFINCPTQKAMLSFLILSFSFFLFLTYWGDTG